MNIVTYFYIRYFAQQI